MLQKISSQTKSSSIAICIYDNLKSCTSNWTREIVVNLSDFMINRFLKNGFDVIVGDNEDQLLSITDNYSHAVVISAGTSFRLSDRLLEAVRQKCKETFYIAGHVLNREDSYYELHHQFYIVDLKQHKELGYPSVGQACDTPLTISEPVQTSQDGYICQTLTLGSITKTYSNRMHGWNILSQALINGKTVIDLGEDIRNNKKYFYHEYDHVFLRDSSELHYYQFMFNNIVVPFNSDALQPGFAYNGPVEQYITTGTGLNWVINLHKLGFDKDTRVVFTDVNPLVLKFMQNMVENWNGFDYVDFWLEQNTLLPNNLPYNFDQYVDSYRTQWKKFVEENPIWLEQWNTVKTLSFNFVSIDYMANYNLDWIDSSLNTVFNVSDVFDHVPNVHLLSVKYRIACENRFLSLLKEKDENMHLLITSRSVQGLMKDPQVGFYKVKDIQLTDIDNIIKPYWHNKDWKTLRPLM